MKCLKSCHTKQREPYFSYCYFTISAYQCRFSCSSEVKICFSISLILQKSTKPEHHANFLTGLSEVHHWSSELSHGLQLSSVIHPNFADGIDMSNWFCCLISLGWHQGNIDRHYKTFENFLQMTEQVQSAEAVCFHKISCRFCELHEL